MLLQSHRSFDVLAKFDPSTGAFETFSKADVPGNLATKGKDGIFDYLNSHRIILYRRGKELVVQVDDHRINLIDLSIELIPTTEGRCLRFHSNGDIAVSIEYKLPSNLTFDDDPTAFAESEDFDFGQFLVNVSKDRMRQERMFEER
jgi:hypothetical protein